MYNTYSVYYFFVCNMYRSIIFQKSFFIINHLTFFFRLSSKSKSPTTDDRPDSDSSLISSQRSSSVRGQKQSGSGQRSTTGAFVEGGSGGYHSGGSGGYHAGSGGSRPASGRGSGGSDRRSAAGSIGSGCLLLK